MPKFSSGRTLKLGSDKIIWIQDTVRKWKQWN